jgi:hypothetical protein
MSIRSSMKNRRHPILSALATLCLAASRLLASDPSVRLELRLEGAVAQFRDGKMGKPVHLDIYAERDGGRWRDVWAESDEFNRAVHAGRITETVDSADGLRLTVELALEDDNWIKGGPAAYDIDLKRDVRTGALEGTFSGVFRGPGAPFAARGAAAGCLLPPVPVETAFVPVEPREHPRLLFRRSELQALRAKAKTPFGKAMVELLRKSSDPVALGLLYQLTGDRSWAERAAPATVKTMDDRSGGPFALGRFWGYRTSVVGTAYDLCYDAWEPAFRERVEDYLDWITYKCLHRMHRVGTVNWQPGSNYTVVIHAGNGMAALALEGEKGPPPVEPLPPLAGAPRPAPLSGDGPPAGVPVVRLEPGQMPTEWLWIGPFEERVLQHEHPYFDYKAPVDPLASAGGMENVRPVPGTKVTFKGRTLEWQALSRKDRPDLFEGENQHAGKTVLRTYKISGRENTHLFFYTVLENDRPGYWQLEANFYEGKCFIAGRRVNHGEIVHLERGRFPLLVPAAMADGEYACFLHFTESTEEKAKAFYADPARGLAYEKARKGYEERFARWKAAGGANLAWLDFADTLRHWNYLCLRQGMGDGGFQGEGEGYTLECHHVIHDYACSFRNVFGREVTGHPDIGQFAARYIATAIWAPGGEGGRERCSSQSFGGHGGGTISARYMARSIALCPGEWRPALLWHWLKQLGASAEEIRTEAGARRAFSSREYGEGLDLAQAFIHYPLDLEPRSPDGLLPRAWEARTRGFYSFRNGWAGADDIVAQIYAKAGASCGWGQAEAGCFQIRGLGHAWAWKDNDAAGKEGSRWLDNVVMLPEDPIDAWAQGQVTYVDGDPRTGSGVVSFDLENVYRCLRTVGQGKGARREAFDGGIHGMRSFAVDYSGKSGAPGLFAVADRITGGKKKIWMWQLPHAGRDGPDYKLEIQGNSFTLACEDASLKATFVSPKNVKIAPTSGRMNALQPSGVSEADVNAIHATGEDPSAGDFFVVMTLQRGRPPEVKVDGDKVRVGNRILEFDGKRIAME